MWHNKESLSDSVGISLLQGIVRLQEEPMRLAKNRQNRWSVEQNPDRPCVVPRL